ncbi:tRNA pseudouridine(38-40) synthase TruA [Altibacter sp. HG106]|uniref:tRNA pseudouridine(38-40) synthase TruA n=1 Tax=Altibacter sp. HG106 TaxID=3023937 RepID=UPI002350AD89|nr:tRNA pseudouridine(38-40) synthase TruA [Altibacter sp. HG106]MDC7995827.1 tRNA pseudouridine(38-40) synthase TruA [Altibacter sp. HG106]
MRYFFDISYHGKNYHGWQIQPDAITVQEVLQQTMSTFFRTPLAITGAGRTDTGVHAKQLYFHVDVDAISNREATRFKLNRFLPKDISIQNIIPVTPDAHARFDATSRTYEYWITLDKNPFLQETAWQLHRTPDIDRMNTAAAILLEHQDFECFSRTHSNVKTFLCDIQKAHWQQRGQLLIFTITADRFLRNMVRAIVGTLMDIGLQKQAVEDFRRILASGDRTQAGASAPAHGLYLTEVQYPDHIFLKQHAD